MYKRQVDEGLTVDLVAGSGVKVDGRTVSAKLKEGGGISADDTGLQVDVVAGDLWQKVMGALHGASLYFAGPDIVGFLSHHGLYTFLRVYPKRNCLILNDVDAYNIAGRKAVAVYREPVTAVFVGSFKVGDQIEVWYARHGSTSAFSSGEKLKAL